MERLDPRGATAAALAAVLYGSSYVATAFALRTFTPLGVAAARGLLGALLLAAILLLPTSTGLRPRNLSPSSLWRVSVLAVLGGPAFIVPMNVAVLLAGATVTAFVAGLYAVLAAALAIPLLGERPERSTVVALMMALIGTFILGDLRLSGQVAGGIGSALVAATAFALFLALSRRWSEAYGLPGPTIGFGTLGMTAAGVGALIPLLGDPAVSSAIRPDASAAVIWLAVGPGAMAAVLVVTGMRRLPARRVSAFLLLNPPTAALGAWLLLGERLSALQLAGGALVLLSIAGASGLFRRSRSR